MTRTSWPALAAVLLAGAVLSAQAPVQAVVALVASSLTEGVPSAATLAAVLMIASGEVIVASAQRTARPR